MTCDLGSRNRGHGQTPLYSNQCISLMNKHFVGLSSSKNPLIYGLSGKYIHIYDHEKKFSLGAIRVLKKAYNAILKN